MKVEAKWSGSYPCLCSGEWTLFIDEIDSLPLDLQAKLLLFLDNQKVRPVGGRCEMKVSTRLIFASGKNLEALVQKGLMRKDFYFRLKTGVSLNLSPLRKESPVKEPHAPDPPESFQTHMSSPADPLEPP